MSVNTVAHDPSRFAGTSPSRTPRGEEYDLGLSRGLATLLVGLEEAPAGPRWFS